MLVLSQKKNQRISVGENVSIVVVEVKGDQVRLGIDAPIDIPVHRQEVRDAIAFTNADHSGGFAREVPLSNRKPRESSAPKLLDLLHRLGSQLRRVEAITKEGEPLTVDYSRSLSS